MGNFAKRWMGDPALFLAVLLMTAFGIAMIYSAGVLNIPSPITEGAWIRQLRWAGPIGRYIHWAAIQFKTASRP